MNRTTKIIIVLVVIAIVFFIGAILLQRFAGDGLTANENTNTNGRPVPVNRVISDPGSGGNNNVATNTPTNTSANTNSTQGTLEPQELAYIFTERYGSYSSDSDFANIEDLMIFMSDSFAAIQENDVKEQRLRQGDEELPFYGITTRALSHKVMTETDTAITFKVYTRRTERKELTDPETFEQNIIMELILEDGTWKVNTAAWQ